jgi:hypothetical protein
MATSGLLRRRAPEAFSNAFSIPPRFPRRVRPEAASYFLSALDRVWYGTWMMPRDGPNFFWSSQQGSNFPTCVDHRDRGVSRPSFRQ